MKKLFKKQILSLILCLTMIMGLIPSTSFTVSAENAVEAVWGESIDSLTESGTLNDAFIAAKNDNNITYVKLVNNLTASEIRQFTSAGGNFTFDLNGYTIDGSEAKEFYPLLIKSSTVTITDTSDGKTGGIKGKVPIEIGKTATVTINGGTYQTIGNTPVVLTSPNNNVILKISGGTYRSDGVAITFGKGDISIEGGNFEAPTALELQYGTADFSQHPDPAGLTIKHVDNTEETILWKYDGRITLPYGYDIIDKDGNTTSSISYLETYTIIKKEGNLNQYEEQATWWRSDSAEGIFYGDLSDGLSYISYNKDKEFKIKLQKDILNNTSYEVSSGNFELDLNGSKLDAKINFKGDVVANITDSSPSESGKIIKTIELADTASLTISSGMVEVLDRYAVDMSFAGRPTQAELNIMGGTVYTVNAHGAKVSVSGGTLNASLESHFIYHTGVIDLSENKNPTGIKIMSPDDTSVNVIKLPVGYALFDSDGNKADNMVANGIYIVQELPAYSIVVESNNGGTAEVDKNTAYEGDIVDVSIRAEENYELDNISVTDANGIEVPVSSEENKNTFIMPDSNIIINVTFKPIHSHEWKYSVEQNSIKAICSNEDGRCFDTSGGSVTIIKPENTSYTGNEINAELTYSDDWQLGELTITYNDTDRVNVTDNDIEASITLGSETASITYQITEVSIENAEVSADNQVYTGSALTPDVSLTLNGKTLSKDTDYTVSYENNINAGTVTVTVTGIGNYTGTATGTFTITDETEPTGEIKIKDNSWKTFLNDVSFGLFFKDTVDVTITADGTGSDVVKVECLLSDTVLSADNLPTDGWTELAEKNGVYSFSITSRNKSYVYAKITDMVGNDTVINSNGVVVYTDSIIAEKTAYHTYKSTEDLVIEVELNGNTVKDLAFNGDKITNYWSVDGNKVTIDGDYLGTLNVLDEGSSYPITIYFNPMGEETDKVVLQTEVSLIITQAEGYVTDISAIGKTYDGTAVNAPAYTSLSSGTATYEYKVQGADDSTYTTNAPDSVGDYVVRVTVAADHWYKEASAIAEFSIREADLTDVSVVQNGTLTYIGKGQTAEVTTKATALGEQTVTFTYSIEENGTYDTIPKFTNAGDYIVYYKASAPNHKDAYGSFIVTIDKAVVTEPTIESKAYTGEVQTADVSGTDLYTVEVNDGGTAKGEYDVTLKLTDAENYKWKSTDAVETTLKFVITGAKNSWTTEPSINGWTYGEDANAPGGAAAFGTVKVIYTGTANDGTQWNSEDAPSKAGNYTATFTVVATAYYGGLEKAVDFTITKETYDMSDAKWDYTNAFTYDGLEKTVYVTGLPEGVTVANYIGEKATAAGTYTAKATLTYDGDNYHIPTVADLTWKIENNWTPVEYTVSVPNDNGWLNEDFVITAADGYLISHTNTANGEWSENLTGAVEGADNSKTFYLKNKSTGAISLSATESYKLDKNTENTGTTGKVFFDERNGWETFLNTITFNLFFKEKVTVKVEAADGLSGVDSIEYMESSTAMSLDELKSARSVWAEMPEDGVAVTLEESKQFIYYVRITDIAGNVIYLSTDGVEYDTTAPAISGIVNGDTYHTTQNVTISDKNLDTVTLNGKTANANITLEGNNDATYTIVATDKAGNVTTFVVTMKPVDAMDASIDDITKDNVDSSDKDAIYDVIDKIDDLLADEELTENEKAVLEELKDKAEALLEQLADADKADETENIEKVKDITSENVTPDDKSNLEDAKSDLEKALEDYNNNYTEEEKKIIEDQIDCIDDALDVVERVENVEDLIDKIPDKITKDSEDKIEAAMDAYNSLTDYEKSLVDKAANKVLENAEKELETLKNAEKESSKNDEESDKTNVPDTGNYVNMLGNIIVMMASAMAIVLIAISKKRKVRK